MLSPVTPGTQPDAARPASTALPVLRWDGRDATALIALVEARLAAGLRFVVLARTSPLGRGADTALLERWWQTAHARLGGLCAGWAILVPGADVNPGLLLPAEAMPDLAAFPIRTCADQGEALWWLRSRLVRWESEPVPLQ